MILQREDGNGDGQVSKDEFKGPPRLFDRIDGNQDGVITKKEFDSQRRQRPGQPQTDSNSPERRGPSDVTVHRDVVFGTGGGRELKMHIVEPKESSSEALPAYVWIHGGGWMGGTKDGGVGKVTPMVRQGFVGATIEYRLTGEAPFPAQIEDCKCAIRFLRAHAKQYNIDPNRIAVGGSSAGGHLVALLGTSGGTKELEGDGGWEDQSSSVQAVVDFFGPTDFKLFVTAKGYERHNQEGSPESRLLGGGEVLPNTEGIKRVNPITYLDKDDPPYLIIHGTKDGTVPPNQSEALHEALDKAGVANKLHLIDGAGHGGPQFATPEVNRMVQDFLIKTIGKPQSK
ncbi:alpha/beta hydrolase fold domain-containing protein [Stieleria sp. JC731]|uniref:alpha/beta hydrolase fold domain-containing protein n=1 Tax=Pirellulaceae TaxID=2691357 RepID=UPI001E64420C|nr:alpha/beta hydrolase fold domain-containing protein [Stieleria sp. JC731]MCC9602145.1 alpha/beta hydrolase fold domain-containing protein [Stieleria sp. JC731]